MEREGGCGPVSKLLKSQPHLKRELSIVDTHIARLQ